VTRLPNNQGWVWGAGSYRMGTASPTRSRRKPSQRHADRPGLTNDLRADKDQREESLSILTPCNRAGARTALEDVEHQIEHHVQTHSELLGAAPDPGLAEPCSTAPAEILRTAVGVCRITDMQEEPWPSYPIPKPRVTPTPLGHAKPTPFRRTGRSFEYPAIR
jgi:hypothetical protein